MESCALQRRGVLSCSVVHTLVMQLGINQTMKLLTLDATCTQTVLHVPPFLSQFLLIIARVGTLR